MGWYHSIFCFQLDQQQIILNQCHQNPGSCSYIGYYYVLLGGGFKHFLFSPLLGEVNQFDEYFSKGLKPPTKLYIRVYIYILTQVGCKFHQQFRYLWDNDAMGLGCWRPLWCCIRWGGSSLGWQCSAMRILGMCRWRLGRHWRWGLTATSCAGGEVLFTFFGVPEVGGSWSYLIVIFELSGLTVNFTGSEVTRGHIQV